MAERLIEILVPDAQVDAVTNVLEDDDSGWYALVADGNRHLFRLCTGSERVESLLDMLDARLGEIEGAQVVVLPVSAVRPRRPEPEKDDARKVPVPLPGRVSREELHGSLTDQVELTPVYMITVVLSAVVAAIGLDRNSPAIVIGAMVIAPLLGPNMALALGTILADGKLVVRALQANVLGALLAVAVALIAGVILKADTKSSLEIASRTEVGIGEVLLALATGAAGAIAVTKGIATSLVGVMVAVALLPPLVTAGMLAVRGDWQHAGQALLLVAVNVVCLNLAAIVTFYARGIRPRTWWEAERGRRATKTAVAVWLALLIGVVVLIWLNRRAG